MSECLHPLLHMVESLCLLKDVVHYLSEEDSDSETDLSNICTRVEFRSLVDEDLQQDVPIANHTEQV